MNALYWLIALVVLLVIEAVTLGLTTIWFAGGALVALAAALLGADIWIQIGCFLVVSLILLIFTRPLAIRYMNKDVVRTNVDSVISMEAVVTEDIDNLLGTGRAAVRGNPWTARAENPQERIPSGATVEVVRVEGVKLIVREKRAAEEKEVVEHE